MSENSENKEMKTSGLRPPTKIPTMGVSRLPSSSSIKLDGVKSTTFKLDGGSSVKKTADMPYVSKHNGFYKSTIDERKSSSSSDSFMGDARRLSEAGVRRSSGNSVVLTEDTDKFIIGNRIWVGGTKPGQIAYIGETNFGNGEWAGIVLDEPIGKNDGSVSGTRYFQCEPKKGIFARLTNLTFTPLSPAVEDSMAQSSFAAAKPLGFSTPMPKRQGSTVTKTAPKSISQTPISKSSSDLKIGDRVIISSGQGSKLGVLKYRGATQFAPGEWCGIELDDPLGKNNGTVEGIRYFECEDKFGLFAPIAKVSKSPMSASRMSTNCAIHKAKRSPGSMNGSMVSGMTSNTMSSIPTRQTKVSDLDRLKLQLTQMKNENELLRSQVTKAANQADVAEKRLEETIKAQVDKPSETHVNGIKILQNQVDNLKKQIDEEKEKVQNLQFTNEEQNVVNIELKNKNAELLIKIKELECGLDKERNLAKDIEKETMKIFEKEEELCRLKEELESLKKVINNNEDELQKSVSNLSSEVVDKEAELNTLRQTLNENSQTYERLLKESNEKLVATSEKLNKIIEEKDKKIEQNQEMIDQLNEGIKCLSALKNEEHDDIVNNLNNELSKLKNEFKVIIDKKKQDDKITQENVIKVENELRQELNSQLEIKNQEIEQLKKKNSDLMIQISSEENNMEKLKSQLLITSENLKELKTNNLMYSKEALESILQQQIQLTFIKIEDFKKKIDSLIVLKDKQIETCNTTVTKIKEQLLNSKSLLEITLNDKIKEKNNEILILSEKLNQMTIDLEKLEKNNEDVNLELNSALRSVQEKIAIIADLEVKYNKLDCQKELNKNELEKKLKNELEYVNDELACLKLEKSKLEEQHGNLMKSSANATIEMENKLKHSNTLIDNLNKSLDELTLSKKNELDSLNKQLLQIKEEREQILKNQHLELASKDEIINTLSNKLDQTLTEKQKEDLNNANLHAELTNEVNKYQASIKDLQSKINELEVKIASNYESYKNDLELSNKEKESFKLENSNLIEKVKLLENSKLNLEEKLESIEVCKQDLQNLNDAIIEKNKIIDDNQIKLKQFDNLISQTKNEFEVIIKEKEEEIKELSKIGEEKMQMEKLSLEEKTKFILNEKDKENSALLKKIEDLENMKISFEKQLEVNKLQELDLKKLNDTVQQKMKMIEDYNLKIDQLNNLLLLNQNEFETKLQEKEIEIVQLLKTGEEKLNFEKEQMEKQIEVILNENSNLLEKINVLEKNMKEQKEINKTQENLIVESEKFLEEKTKTIHDGELKIDLLNKMILNSKEEFDSKLKEKEDETKESIEREKQKLIDEKCILEKNTKIILDNKDIEILNLVEKLNILEIMKLNFEKQLEISKAQEYDIIELKKVIEEKTKVIDDNNLQIEQLNSHTAQIKKDLDMKLKEKENEIEELVKVWEEKLNIEKITFETHIKTDVDKKNTEIEVLKTRLQEFSENNGEKELMLKLEFVNEELEKEKIRASSLEVSKSELEKTVLNHKTELEKMEVLKSDMENNMTKMIKDLQNHIAKIKTESEQLDGEKLLIQKQIDELKIECSVLKSTLNDKDKEIENLKTQVSQNLKTTDPNNDELNQLKALLERDRSSQSHLEFRIQELTDENHRLNERIESDTSLLQKNHNIIQEKYKIEKKYEETYSMLKIKENQILVLQTELNSWKLKDMEKSKNDNFKEKTDKTETLLLAEKNEEIKMLNSIILGLHKKLSAVMESDVSEFDIENNPSAVSKEDYQKLYKTAKNNVKLKECENLSLKQEVYKLKTENDRFSELKTKCETLENDKKTLQKLIVNYESSHPVNVKNENSDTKSETAKILEEKDWQINLLNNIIADLHSKVSDNKFKIEALEKQIMDSGVNHNKKVRIRTTRLYCEQCEIFDSHDTEDCPEKPESPKFQKKRKVVYDNTNKTTEEPFCVCCDMFGHTADECDSSLTF